jgi:hypothetical protein
MIDSLNPERGNSSLESPRRKNLFFKTVVLQPPADESFLNSHISEASDLKLRPGVEEMCNFSGESHVGYRALC